MKILEMLGIVKAKGDESKPTDEETQEINRLDILLEMDEKMRDGMQEMREKERREADEVLDKYIQESDSEETAKMAREVKEQIQRSSRNLPHIPRPQFGG